MKRRVLIALYASAALAAPAMAQDTFNWTGFHAGFNAGYGEAQYNYPLTGSFSSGTNQYAFGGGVEMNATGFLGGGQIGYDYLYPNGWLIGFETDADATVITPKFSASGLIDTTGSYDFSGDSNLDFLATARARVGYVLPQNVLIYGTAGLAYGGLSTNFDFHVRNGINTVNVNVDRFAVDIGWTVGAGAEYPITDRVSLRAEYLYASLGSQTVVEGTFLTPALTGSGSLKAETSAHIGRLALNYTF